MDFDMLDGVEEEKKVETSHRSWPHSKSIGSQRAVGLGSDKDAVVSPYAIRNLTETEIIIQKELTQDEIQRNTLHE